MREIYVARPGRLILASDMDQAEMCALAQSCWTRFGKSTLLELINGGIDAHMWFGEKVARDSGVDWSTLSDDKKKWYRQYAKVGNFGQDVKVPNFYLKVFKHAA